MHHQHETVKSIVEQQLVYEKQMLLLHPMVHQQHAADTETAVHSMLSVYWRSEAKGVCSQGLNTACSWQALSNWHQEIY